MSLGTVTFSFLAHKIEHMKKKLLLFGNSILIAGLESGGLESGGFEVYRANDLRICQELPAFDVVITDVNNPAYAEILMAFIKRPVAHLVCIDAAAGTLTALVSTTFAVHSIDDVLQWIGKHGQVMSVLPFEAKEGILDVLEPGEERNP